MKTLATLILTLALATAATAAEIGQALMINSNGTIKSTAPASSNFWNTVLSTLGSNATAGGNSAPFTNVVNGSSTLLTISALNGGTGVSFTVTPTNLSNWSAELIANYGLASQSLLGATQGSNVTAFANVYTAIGSTQGSNVSAFANLYTALGNSIGSNQSSLVSLSNQVDNAGYLTGGSNFVVAGANINITKTGATYYISSTAAGGGGITLADVYGALGNLRPTNTVPPAITGSVTNNATIDLSYGTFFSLRGYDYQTNQCWVWADDWITNGAGYYVNIGTNATVTLPAYVGTGTVLYVGATVTNLFGMGSAISAGITVTNGSTVVGHYRLKEAATIENASGGLGYESPTSTGLSSSAGSPASAFVLSADVDAMDGHCTAYYITTAGDYPAPLTGEITLDQGGTGDPKAIILLYADDWEEFTP